MSLSTEQIVDRLRASCGHWPYPTLCDACILTLIQGERDALQRRVAQLEAALAQVRADAKIMYECHVKARDLHYQMIDEWAQRYRFLELAVAAPPAERPGAGG